MTSVLLGQTASYYLALEARGPTVHSLERAVQAVEGEETVVEAVVGSVWPPQVLEEIQHCHRPQHYDALGRELDLGWRSPCKENNYKFCE